LDDIYHHHVIEYIGAGDRQRLGDFLRSRLEPGFWPG